MPRAKKTLSGERGQPAKPITGQQYGRQVEQQRLQQAMPAPQLNVPITAPTPTNTPTPQAQQTAPDVVTNSAPPQQSQGPDMSALMTQLKGMGGLLRAPDDQPNVPFTAGLSSGPQTNSMAPATPFVNRTGQLMRDLSAQTGDPIFAKLAAKARM